MRSSWHLRRSAAISFTLPTSAISSVFEATFRPFECSGSSRSGASRPRTVFVARSSALKRGTGHAHPIPSGLEHRSHGQCGARRQILGRMTLYPIPVSTTPNDRARGLIDAQGRVVVEPHFARIDAFHEGMAAVVTTDGKGRLGRHHGRGLHRAAVSESGEILGGSLRGLHDGRTRGVQRRERARARATARGQGDGGCAATSGPYAARKRSLHEHGFCVSGSRRTRRVVASA